MKLKKESERLDSAQDRKKLENIALRKDYKYKYGNVEDKQSYIDMQKRRIKDEIKIKNKEIELLESKGLKNPLDSAKELKILELEKNKNTKQHYNKEFKKMYEPYKEDVKQLISDKTYKTINNFADKSGIKLEEDDIKRIKADFEKVKKYYKNMKEDKAKYDEQIKALKNNVYDEKRNEIISTFDDKCSKSENKLSDLNHEKRISENDYDYFCYYYVESNDENIVAKYKEQLDLKIKKTNKQSRPSKIKKRKSSFRI